MYKEPKSYKGFESWWHAAQMTVKMYFYTFILVLFIHLAVVSLYLILFQPDLLRVVADVFIGFHHQLWGKAISILIKKTFWVFVISSPVWFLYPALLGWFKKRSENLIQDRHLRGLQLISDKDLAKVVLQDIKSRGEDLLQLLHIGKVPLPSWSETRHFLVLGRPGTGKTTLLNQILLKLRERGQRVIIHDFKGDYLSYFYDPERDIIFNPLDTRSVNWCLFSEIQTDADVDSIAASLIPPSRHEDKFWTDAARDVFSSIVHILLRTGKTTNEDLYQYTTATEQELIEILTQAVSQGLDQAKRAVGYLQGYEKGSKVASDVLATMKQYTNCFYYAKHLKSEFSIKQWLENDQPGFVFITNYANLQDTLKPLLSLFVDLLLKHLLSMSESLKRRVFFVLDEFASLQKLTTIVRALETARSKGGSIWIAAQDVNQLQKIYGHETANTIVNTTNSVVAFALNDPASCEYLSKTFGERELLETDESLSMGPEDMRDGLSITRRRKTERLLLPSEFSKLPDLTCYLKLLSYDAAKTKIDLIRLQPKNPSFVLDERFKLNVSENA